MLGGLIFHSITWFNLAPKAMVIKLGDKPIPGIIIALMNYGGWVAISLFFVWLFMQAS
jgi:fumarate reductase subunit C